MDKRRRKNKAAKQREHFRKFHRAPKPRKSIDDLTDYEVEQIWAEAVQNYKTGGANQELSAEELELAIKAEPLMKVLKAKIERIAAEKMSNTVKYSLS